MSAPIDSGGSSRRCARGGCSNRERAIAIARAPGRLDVMGGIADYSGSLVLQRPIAEGTCRGGAARSIGRCSKWSASAGRRSASRSPRWPRTVGRSPTTTARRRFAAAAMQRWAAYVIGVFLVLARERGLPLTSGARIVIASRVPEGKGVSSSAALETACMQAVGDAPSSLAIEPRDLALLCQQAENLVAGAPCGVMDQMTCVFGEARRADGAAVPAGRTAATGAGTGRPRAVWGIDSGERHAVGGSDYGVGARRRVHGSADPCRSRAGSRRIPRQPGHRRNSSASRRSFPRR